MANLFQKHKLSFALTSGFFVLFVLLSSCAQNGILTTPTPNQELSTPELIDQALARSEISEEERLLYLAYAIFEYKSLPAQFHSKVGWRGTAVLEELEEVANSQAALCSMSPYVLSEFKRLLKPKIKCN